MPSDRDVSRAVVVMGRVPSPGKVKTRLAPAVAPADAAALYRAFLLDVFDVVEAARAKRPFDRCFSCALEEGETMDDARILLPHESWRLFGQWGADLGERIESARENGLSEHVVVIGSDSPTMAPSRILDAFAALDAGNDAAIGPAEDGGYDLIAFRRPLPALLSDIPWSTDRVMDATRAAAKRAGLSLAELSTGFDVDRAEDLPRALAESRRPGSLATRTRAAIEAVLAKAPRAS